jgi:hypothetical protein
VDRHASEVAELSAAPARAGEAREVADVRVDGSGRAGQARGEDRADPREELGSAKHVVFPVDAPAVEATSVGALFTAEVGGDEPVRPGQRWRLTLDPSRFHFFDSVTGERLPLLDASR